MKRLLEYLFKEYRELTTILGQPNPHIDDRMVSIMSKIDKLELTENEISLLNDICGMIRYIKND